MGSHIAEMLYALRTPHSKFCKDGLIMVDWPKHNWNWLCHQVSYDMICVVDQTHCCACCWCLSFHSLNF